MGEVYRARDTRLDRTVAIKVLPESVAEDPERLARFEREAKTLAALNHTNVAQVYGIEGRALAMEFVEGRDLSSLITQGPMPVDEVMAIARQIADALDSAHQAGIIHRDLKPSNIRVREDGVVKVLDFGLAKALAPPGAALDSTSAPTITSPAMTHPGVILGTAGYMAPEQARGRAADRRADIWAFGVVVYEMATGRRAFDGENVSEVLASVIKSEPDWTAVPPELRRLVKSCLEKDPKRRLRDIGDWWRQVDDGASTAVAVERARFPWLAWGTAAALLVAAGALAWVHLREQPPANDVLRFFIQAPEKTTFETGLAVSPDGRRVAFTAKGPDDVVRVWVRDLDQTDSRVVAGTDGARSVFWSPDSRLVGFISGKTLKKAQVDGGRVDTLFEGESADSMGGGAGMWGPDGRTILLGGYRAGAIWKVPATGGSASPATVLDRSRDERAHGLAAFLPDGKHFLYLRVGLSSENSGVFIGSIDRAAGAQDLTRLLEANQTFYVATGRSTGVLVYLQRGTLLARPFDAARLVLTGEPVQVAEGVGNFGAAGFFSAVTNVLAYRAGATVGASRLLQLTLRDRKGNPLGTPGDPAAYEAVAFSPDGTRAAAIINAITTAGIGNADVWVIDLARNVSQRLTLDPAIDRYPVWSPAGDRIVFGSMRNKGGKVDLFIRSSDMSGADELLSKTDASMVPTNWSPDGRYVLFTSPYPNTPTHVWLLPMDGTRTPRPLIQTAASESEARLSRDRRWVSYTSNVSGRPEVYVRPFNPESPASAGGVVQITKDGGSNARWRQDGKEMFYLSAAGMVTAVEISGPGLVVGTPKELFALPTGSPWDVSPDGQRFLVGVPPASAGLTPITVVTNWTTGLVK